MKKAATYKSAGVDIDAGAEAVRRMRGYVRRTFNRWVLGDLGSFGGLFRFPARRYRDPVLVSSTDGVGTKLLIAAAVGRYHTVGQDLVHHCVNDILVQGARPLFFLDYYATGRLDPRACAETVRGLALACKRQGCVLIGGETAEMPGLYKPGDFDLAGTIVGVVERCDVITGERVRPGDAVLGIPSTGLHTNGYSLARKVLLKPGVSLTRIDPELGMSLADALLAVHRCYAPAVLPLLGKLDIRALAHLTGGGFYDNIPRVLPPNCGVVVRRGSWPVPAIFRKIVRQGGMSEREAHRVFNMGVGMAVIVPRTQGEACLRALERLGFPSFRIGEVVRGRREVVLV